MDAASILLILVAAGQTAWTPDRYNPATPAAASTYDRYGPPTGVSNSAVAPPPSVINRAQSAVTETGTALREGVEAGIQAANQQLSQRGGEVLEGTRNAGQEFGRQLQNWVTDPDGQLQSITNDVRTAGERTLGTVRNQLPRVSNPFANSGAAAPAVNRTPNGVAPPPWPTASAATSPAATGASSPFAATVQSTDPTASRGMTPRQTASGWTSIGSNVAAPPLLVPKLDTAPVRNASPHMQMAVPTEGPQLPNPTSTATTPANGADDWATTWGTDRGTTQPTISRNGSAPAIQNPPRESGLVAVTPLPQETPPAPQRTERSGDLWADADLWGRSTQSAPAGTAAPANVANNPPSITSDANDWQLGGNRPSPPATQEVSNQVAPPGVVNNLGAAPPLDRASQTAATAPTLVNQSAATAIGEQPPWLPLLVVSLSLMGSLSANLFLGWSYMDARQKYRSLVRKTADTFRRATKAAA